MVNVYYQEDDQLEPQQVSIEREETLLDGLLRTGHKVPFGCKEGVCQSCLMTAPDRNAPEESVCGLTPNQVEQGAFLSCRCIPIEGFRVNSTELAGRLVEVKVLEMSALSEKIFRLRVEKALDYKPGQFVTLWNNNDIARSYSIASHPDEDDYMEFHIKRVINGAFSEWAWENLFLGDILRIQGPIGKCYYGSTPADKPLVLSGMGTGLAPLVGIARDALSKGHTGDIIMFIAARDSASLYLIPELNALQSQHTNIHVSLVAQTIAPEYPSNTSIIEGDIYQIVKDRVGSFKDHIVYLCGTESFVTKMKKLCFLGGANMNDIHADPFIPFHK